MAKVTSQLSVGLTDELVAAVELASEMEGIRPSQMGRLALVERLVSRGYMESPAQRIQRRMAEGAK
ncbi:MULTISPECIES: hypothetical protein [unclassified Bradyrhizobium]|uniref:hypothetical protein n=1 Tax=unclassified Bradyrhizobium TaxID=2631580 RepID=UPI002916D7E3|nr:MULTISPECIES: hypothetical protein [unclassified Bradyrhizobium]